MTDGDERTRREVVGLAGAALATGLAGCLNDGGGPGATTTEVTTTETPTETTTSTPTETTTETTTPTPMEDRSGREIYMDWIFGSDGQILEEATDEISFDAVENALEGGTDEVTGVVNALETASEQYSGSDDDYEDRHRHIMAAVHTAIERTDTDIDIVGIADWAKSTAFPSTGVDYSKIWVKPGDDTEYTDINAALAHSYQHTTHVEGETPDDQIERELEMARHPENFANRSPHDYDTHQESRGYDREELDREYSDEQIEDANGWWLNKFDNYVFGDGLVVPSSVEDWEKFHEGIENGPEMILNLNDAYRNSEYAGETAQFTVNDGSVTIEDVPEGYNPSDDGVPGNPAA